MEGKFVREEKEDKWEERKMMNGNSLGMHLSDQRMDTKC